MRFRSTRSASQSLTLSEAISQSIASDGGLYVPERFPTFNAEDFAGLNSWNEIGKRLLEPFFCDDDLTNENAGPFDLRNRYHIADAFDRESQNIETDSYV